MKHMLELPSPFPSEPGRVRLLEAPGSDPAALATLLVEGRYDKPFVL
jgi:spermidine synthase